MTGFEPRTSGIGGDHRSTNSATNTAQRASFCLFSYFSQHLAILLFGMTVSNFKMSPLDYKINTEKPRLTLSVL